VRPFTEFKLFSIEAVHAYALDTGDTSLAERLFTQQPEWLAEYSLRQFIQSDGLVHKRTREGFNTRPPSSRAQRSAALNAPSSITDERAGGARRHGQGITVGGSSRYL
jgi:hypothetical protein